MSLNIVLCASQAEKQCWLWKKPPPPIRIQVKKSGNPKDVNKEKKGRGRKPRSSGSSRGGIPFSDNGVCNSCNFIYCCCSCNHYNYLVSLFVLLSFNNCNAYWCVFTKQIVAYAGYNCGICRKTMTEPVTTPCAHNFCKACLEAAHAGISTITERSRGGRDFRPKKNIKKCPSCPLDIADFVDHRMQVWQAALVESPSCCLIYTYHVVYICYHHLQSLH